MVSFKERRDSWTAKINDPESEECQSQIRGGVRNDSNGQITRGNLADQLSIWQTKIKDPPADQKAEKVYRPEYKEEFQGSISLWKQKEIEHREKQLINPFSEWEGASHRPQLDKNDPNYGKPLPGSLTEIRGKQASNQVFGEIRELCLVIDALGKKGADDKMYMSFGRLFSAYEKVSTNLVGILIRARKRDCVAFEGEMLYQGRDEGVIIKLLEIPEDTREKLDVPDFLSGGFE